MGRTDPKSCLCVLGQFSQDDARLVSERMSVARACRAMNREDRQRQTDTHSARITWTLVTPLEAGESVTITAGLNRGPGAPEPHSGGWFCTKSSRGVHIPIWYKKWIPYPPPRRRPLFFSLGRSRVARRRQKAGRSAEPAHASRCVGPLFQLQAKRRESWPRGAVAPIQRGRRSVFGLRTLRREEGQALA